MGSTLKAYTACAVVYIAATFGQLDPLWPLHAGRDFRYIVIFASFALWIVLVLWNRFATQRNWS